jgi:hypothetical protein
MLIIENYFSSLRPGTLIELFKAIIDQNDAVSLVKPREAPPKGIDGTKAARLGMYTMNIENYSVFQISMILLNV